MIQGTSVPQNSVLLTDLYQLTMGQQYFDLNQKDYMATFEVFVRKFPKGRKAMVMAGMDDVRAMTVDNPNKLFNSEDIAFLRGRQDLSPDFVSYLESMRYTGEMWAMNDGDVFLENEPILRLTAPIIQAQLLETYILNCLGFSISVATKAARVVGAARGHSCADFSPRRCQGMDAAMRVAKYSYMVGFASTSNVEAGKRYGIPLSGTVAHSFITSQQSEKIAFEQILRGNKKVVLVDTYDTKRGIDKLLKDSRAQYLKGIRIDSGNLVELSKYARKALDKAKIRCPIIASGDLDEYKIDRLLRAGADINGFGVGTALGTVNDAPALGITYKLVNVQEGQRPNRRDCMKTSNGKATLPGIKQVYRFFNHNDGHVRDEIGLVDEYSTMKDRAIQNGGYCVPMLESVVCDSGPASVDDLRKQFSAKSEMHRWLDAGVRGKPTVVVSKALTALKNSCLWAIKQGYR